MELAKFTYSALEKAFYKQTRKQGEQGEEEKPINSIENEVEKQLCDMGQKSVAVLFS